MPRAHATVGRYVQFLPALAKNPELLGFFLQLVELIQRTLLLFQDLFVLRL
jgi:hypothetical protein